jgi:hypothetical protein
MPCNSDKLPINWRFLGILSGLINFPERLTELTKTPYFYLFIYYKGYHKGHRGTAREREMSFPILNRS